MASIGPELPPHLQSRSTHDSEDTTNASSVVGPQIPAHLLAASSNNEDSDEDDYVPELPPDMIVGPSTTPPPPKVPSKSVVGPSLPPSAGVYGRGGGDYDDDDDFGPQPLPAGYQHTETSAVQRFIEKEEKRRREVEEAAKPKTLQRDEWMLVPPSTSDILGKLDPTKLKARQFSRSSAPARGGATDNSLWTETPAERQQRLADEVSGKKRRAVDPKVDEEDDGRRKKRRDEEDIRKGVEDYTRKVRGPALLSQHASTLSATTSSNEAPPAIWDHSRDMSLGGRLMDDDKRNKLVSEAKGLGDRFGTGKSGGFL